MNQAGLTLQPTLDQFPENGAYTVAAESYKCKRPSCGHPVPPQRFRRGEKRVYCKDSCRRKHWEELHPRQRQLPLGPDLAPVPPVVDQTVPIPDCEGLKGQNAAVLARLRRGAATTRQLAEACPGSMAIHSRVADCRTYLKRFGETVTRRRVGPRVHIYFIEPL